jgi:hypothetical protein
MRKPLILILLLLTVATAFSRIVYVKTGAAGANNGTSWLNAYTSLTTALNNSIAGDTLKVATGTYKPGVADTARFRMQNSVVLLGGYSTDTTITTRNWSLYPTILSGEILNLTYPYDNIKTLISGFNINSSAVWDGFIAEASSETTLMLSGNSQPTFRNFIFRNNYADNIMVTAGAAVTSQGGSPKFINCIFHNNNALFNNGTAYFYNGSAPAFVNCLFVKNRSSDTTSVIYLSGSTASITNSTFFGNETVIHDDGRCVIKAINSSTINISNSIFFHNRNKVDFNGGIDVFEQDSSELLLVNSIANVSNTIIQNFTTGTALLVAQNPRFRDTADIDGPDNRLFTSDDGLQLMNPCSPAMNSGNNSSASGIATDLLGNPRIFSNQIVDLGPYEVQSAAITPLRVVYVKKTATGTNDGSSWANAFTDLQKALSYCADTIKVAANTYLPSSQQNRQSAFYLLNHTVVLGGYPNTGNPTDNDRNPQLHITALSGYLSATDRSVNVVYSKRNDSTAILDGFVIRDGGVEAHFNARRSGSVCITAASGPVFRNNVIKNNQEAPCILIYSGSSPKFFDCKIDSNLTGADIYSSNPIFRRCSFTGNTGWVFNNVSSPTVIDSCTFIRNPAAMIKNSSNSNGSISNSRFINNGTLETGPDIDNFESSPAIYKCYFSDSITAQYGGAIRNQNLSSPVIRLCEFRNFKVIYNGGVVYNVNSSPTFVSSVFANNSASNGGVSQNIDNSGPRFINCAAAENMATSGTFMFNVRSFPEIINTTITRHSKNGGPGASVIMNTDSSRLIVKNSILWGNAFAPFNNVIAEIYNEDLPNLQSTTIANNSVTQYYGTNGVNGNLVGVNPRMFEYNDADGLDNIYFTADDGIRLTACSPALNAGNNSYTTETNDILSNARVFGTSIDIGAYEYQAAAGGVSNVSHVNASATGNNSGTSWQNAYTSLWSAINNICTDTIKVAAGTYKPAVSNRDSSFLMMHGKVYLGGYPNTGNPTDAERNPVLHPTILSGNIGNQNDSADNTRHVIYINNVDTAIIIDGFTIMHGQAEYYNTQQPFAFLFQGGGLLSMSSRTTIRNCTFRNNYANSGGGLAISGPPRLHISKTIVKDNRASTSGAGLYLTTSAEAARAVVENCVLENNRTDNGSGQGGGAWVSSSGNFTATGIDFNNIVMIGNYAAVGGGGMYLSSANKVGITNCHFMNNSVSPIARGAGLHSKLTSVSGQTHPTVKNSIFNGNSLGSPGSDQFLGVDIYDPDCPNYNCVTSNISYTRVQTYLYGGANTTIAPQFNNGNDPNGADNLWMTIDDGIIQTPCSQLNNRGNNAAVAQIPFDILGKARVFANVVDLGAYETQGASVSISASDTLICAGTQLTFTGTPVNGGTSPTYQWQVNGVNAGTNSSSFTSSTLNNNDQVKVIMTSNETCLSLAPVSSNVITVHVSSGISSSVTITSSQNTICAGSTITFTAIPVNGGATPSYQWQVNGTNAGTNSNLFSTTALTNGAQVKVIMTSSYTCASPSAATSNIITVTVNPQVTPAVSISASATTICTGTNVTFSATPTNGGSSPSYQWKRNGANVGTNNNVYTNNALATGDIISVVLTSNAACATVATANSNNITMIVNSTVTPSITISGNTVVNTGIATLITATPSNGGAGPSYQWQDSTSTHSWQNIAGATNATINYTPAITGDKLRCILTSNASCVSSANATSNTLSFTVNAVTGISPVQASDYGIICYPNPTRSVLIIDSIRISDKWESISIAGVDGKQNIIARSINNQTRITVDVSILPGGMYAVIFKGKNNKRVYLKFIKL